MQTMKPDNDPLFCHSTLLCKHDSKPSEYDNSVFDTAKLEGIMKEDHNGAFCDLTNCENDTARIASEVNYKDGYFNTPELECIMLEEDSTNCNENEVRIPSSKVEFVRDNYLSAEKNGNENEARNEIEFRESVAAYTIPSSKMELFGKDEDSFTDKNVLECELPELIVCYKDNTYHLVKDICIDEGVPTKDKILIEHGNENSFCTILPSDGNENVGVTKGGDEIELLSSSGSKSSSENDYNEVDTCECGTKERVEADLFPSDELKPSAENEFDDDSGNDGGSLVPEQTVEANCRATEDDVSREKLVTNTFSKQMSLKSLFESSDHDINEIEQQSSKLCESSSMVSTSEEPSKTNNLSYNSKVESGTITFDFNSSKPTPSDRNESPDDSDHEQTLKIETEPKHKDGISDSLSVENGNQHAAGETSFSMAGGPVSGLITYSGPIAYSGSVSLRSESSTTSTRSFAFPILQNEWNSSPIRMANADRRRYRRHRGWRHGLLCCRF